MLRFRSPTSTPSRMAAAVVTWRLEKRASCHAACHPCQVMAGTLLPPPLMAVLDCTSDAHCDELPASCRSRTCSPPGLLASVLTGLACWQAGAQTGDQAAQVLIAVDDGYFRHTSLPRCAAVATPVFSLRTRRSIGSGEFRDIEALADLCAKTGTPMPAQDLTCTCCAAHSPQTLLSNGADQGCPMQACA